MRFSRALEFVKTEYRKKIDIIGDSYLDELTGVADILEEMGYGIEYRLTAVMRNLLRDTDARPDEILDYGSMDILEAIQLLNRDLKCDMYKYISDVKRSMLAQPVKMAEHLYFLRKAEGRPLKEISNLLEQSQKYYTKCAKDTKFYEPILMALMKLKK